MTRGENERGVTFRVRLITHPLCIAPRNGKIQALRWISTYFKVDTVYMLVYMLVDPKRRDTFRKVYLYQYGACIYLIQ